MTTAQLFARYEEDVRRFVRSLVKGPGAEEISKDICQETWLRAFQHEGQFDDAKNWIFEVARNIANDRRRRLKSMSRRDAAVKGTEYDAAEYAEQDGFNCSVSPEAALLTVEAKRMKDEHDKHVTDCLQKLDPKYRMVLEARLQGVKLEDIAKQNNVPLSTVKSWHRRGKSQLRHLARVNQTEEKW